LQCEIRAPQQLLLVILLIHSGARVGALLDAIATQIDLQQSLFDLNPTGREETKRVVRFSTFAAISARSGRSPIIEYIPRT
jgi:hypothetical protein